MIGLVSAIVAFVDFSCNLLDGTWEIYHSLDGVAPENARFEHVMGDLELLTETSKSDIPVKTSAEKSIRRPAQDCKEDAKTLKALLSEMNIESAWEKTGILGKLEREMEKHSE